MGHLDMTGDRDLVGRSHFAITVDGTRLAYCYIRKNACTAFKTFFRAMSPVSGGPADGLAFMLQNHRASPEMVREADHRICILRDPLERTVSLYRNKFIQRNGHQHLFESYEAVTGRPAEEASFRDFVRHYLGHSLDTLDPHAYTQRSHLLPVLYDAALPMNEIASGMAALVGADLADRFFRNSVNSSARNIQHDEPASDRSSAELTREFTRFARLPSVAALADAAITASIRAAYAEDYDVLARYEAGATVPE